MIRKQALEGLYNLTIRRSKPIRVVSNALARFGLKLMTSVKGFDMPANYRKVDAIMYYSMLLGTYEIGTVSLCKRFLRPGMTAVDVGAHVGYYARLFANLVGMEGRVYAFEPQIDNFIALRRNCEKFRNVVLSQAAVTDHEHEVLLCESPVGSGSHSLIASRYPLSVKRTPIQGISLDSFLKQEQVDLVKIDVEGAELEVLRGAQELIRRQDSLALIVEFFPPVLLSRGLNPKELLDRLTGLGFELYAIEEITGALIPLTSWESHEEFIKSIPKYINLLAQKQAKTYAHVD